MTNLNLDDLYQMLLERLRKDRKGGVSPETFESFLRYRNLDYFNKQIGVEDVTKMNHDSLVPFFEGLNLLADVDPSTHAYFANISTTALGVNPSVVDHEVAYIVNVWAQESTGGVNLVNRYPVDLLSSAEYHERYNNAITKGTADYPIAYRGKYNYWNGATYQYIDVLFFQGTVPLASYTFFLDYYRYPADPYFDYYTDSSGNITYLTDGQSAYTLLAGEIARDGKTVGQQVTSASQDLEWRDNDAINILDMIVSDVSIALSDPDSFQASMMEREKNVSS